MRPADLLIVGLLIAVLGSSQNDIRTHFLGMAIATAGWMWILHGWWA